MMKDLILKNRSYRRFYQEVPIGSELLEEWIDLARLSGSGMNLQPLKYIMAHNELDNARIFRHLRWAGYLKEWAGPIDGERPSAYIIMLLDKNIASQCFWDHGIAAQSILLGAVERGFGGCMFGSVDREGLRKDLRVEDAFDILMVLALGKPKETIVLEPLESNGDIKYYRDGDGIHHVPKRSLEEIILR